MIKDREGFVKKLLEMKEKDPENFTKRIISKRVGYSESTLYNLDKEFHIGFKSSTRIFRGKRIRRIQKDIAKILLENGFTIESIGNLLELSRQAIRTSIYK